MIFSPTVWMRYSTSTTGPPRSPRVGFVTRCISPGSHQPAQHFSHWPPTSQLPASAPADAP